MSPWNIFAISPDLPIILARGGKRSWTDFGVEQELVGKGSQTTDCH